MLTLFPSVVPILDLWNTIRAVLPLQSANTPGTHHLSIFFLFLFSLTQRPIRLFCSQAEGFSGTESTCFANTDAYSLFQMPLSRRRY